MTNDDIIRMARVVGYPLVEYEGTPYIPPLLAVLLETVAAAQRTWVGLTPEEVLDLFDINNVYGSKWIEFARTVEAKLKAKNGH